MFIDFISYADVRFERKSKFILHTNTYRPTESANLVEKSLLLKPG